MDERKLDVPGKFQNLVAEHVYDFDRRKDLVGLGEQTGVFQPRPAVVTYLDKKAPTSCFYQAPVASFYAWYRDFPFASLFNDTVKGPDKGKFEW